MSMTDKNLETILARAEEASPGCWVDGRDLDGPCVDNLYGQVCATAYGPDATFIAHAREDVPALVGEVKRLREWIADHCIDGGCNYGDGCPSDANHYQCIQCAAKAALGSGGEE